MHTRNLNLYTYIHDFNELKVSSEKKVLLVVVLTFSGMIFEIVLGFIFNSMALFADGWHMGTHFAALSISAIAYFLARKFTHDRKFAFGTWKIEILGAFTSAIILAIVGIFMIYMSVERFFKPLVIQYNQALIVAFIGLSINLVSAIILSHEHEHSNHEHNHLHNQGQHHHDKDDNNSHHHHNAEHAHQNVDYNLKSAYLHVIADAMTSVLAIIALLCAKYFNLNRLDPLMGIVGSMLILKWAHSLIKETSNILLDREMDTPLIVRIKNLVESDDDTRISDLHVWRVAQNKYACIISIIAEKPLPIDEYKKRLTILEELKHVTIEINFCKGLDHADK